jgi:hypothetical protein
MVDSAYNSFLQTTSLLTNLYSKLLEHSKGPGRDIKNIRKEKDCLKFDCLKHKYKIELSITFKQGGRYQTVILSEIIKKGEARLLKRFYLDKESRIVKFANL